MAPQANLWVTWHRFKKKPINLTMTRNKINMNLYIQYFLTRTYHIYLNPNSILCKIHQHKLIHSMNWQYLNISELMELCTLLLPGCWRQGGLHLWERGVFGHCTLIHMENYVFLSIQIPTILIAAHMDSHQFVEPPIHFQIDKNVPNFKKCMHS